MIASGCLGALTPLASGATVSPDQVLFESRGIVLVLGDNASVADVAEVVARHHLTVLFAPGADARQFGPRINAVGRRVTAVRGHLGAFQAEVRSAVGVSDIGVASPNPNRFFDIVLDLSRQPLMTAELAPLGYFAPGPDSAARATALESMRSLVGRFTKPRYFGYQFELCAHGASGLRGCTRCLDVCSAQAIVSAGASIRVDPYLCKGCATCSLACPTGALSFKFPSRESLFDRLHQTLRNSADRSTLIAHTGTLGVEATAAIANSRATTFEVDPLPAFGDELWLSAIALGVGRLILLESDNLPLKTSATLATSVAQVKAMLPAMGIAKDRLSLIRECELVQWLEAHIVPELEVTESAKDEAVSTRIDLPKGRTKRRTSLDIFDVLQVARGSGAIVELASGATYGEVRVNQHRCTLCFACTQLCPTGALVANDAKTQQLIFWESYCVQCGLCVQGCPEKAMTLHARFAPSKLTETTACILHQDEQMACKSCGTPFISRRLLASSLEKLKDHPVLAMGGRQALMICPACRQRDMLSLS